MGNAIIGLVLGGAVFTAWGIAANLGGLAVFGVVLLAAGTLVDKASR